MDITDFFSNNSDDINSPFWAMGNVNAVPDNYIVTHIMNYNYFQDERPDWIEFSGNEILPKKKIDISIRKLVKSHEKYHDNLFLNESPVLIKSFLQEELQKLTIQVKKESFRYFEKKLRKYEKIEKQTSVTMSFLKERSFWYQRLNMFIFGVNKFGIGSRYVYTLEKGYKELLEEQRISYVKRKKLLVAYSYIFFNDKHRSFNYKTTLTNIKHKFLKFKLKLRKIN